MCGHKRHSRHRRQTHQTISIILAHIPFAVTSCISMKFDGISQLVRIVVIQHRHCLIYSLILSNCNLISLHFGRISEDKWDTSDPDEYLIFSLLFSLFYDCKKFPHLPAPDAILFSRHTKSSTSLKLVTEWNLIAKICWKYFFVAICVHLLFFFLFSHTPRM